MTSPKRKILLCFTISLILTLILVLLCGCDKLLDWEHNIDGEYFDTVQNLTTVNNDGSSTVSLKTVCALPLLEYTYSVEFYDKDKNVIYTSQETTVEKELDKNTEITIEIPLSKEVTDKYSYNILTISGVSEQSPLRLSTKTFKVTYVCNGEVYKTEEVQGGGRISVFKGKEYENLVFSEWYLDSALSIHTDLNDKIYRDKTYYAKYTLDAEMVTNKITTETMQSLVSIVCTSLTKKTNGSGVIFKVEGDKYYVLTNDHVLGGGSMAVFDCYGNEYSAYKVASNKEMDLACIYFKLPSDERKLSSLSLAKSDITAGECCISLGFPLQQKNAITYGSVYDYSLEGDGAVSFKVIQHSAIVTSGCSGGPLLNSSLEIAGINFAKADDGKEFTTGYAIPASKVLEFLIENNIAVSN